MKKIFVLFLLFFAVTSAVSAQSLFPILSTPTPEPSDLAPSYSGFANVEPDQETDYGADGKLLTYNGVSEENYLKFGEYLASFGFEVTETNTNGRAAEMMLNNGQFNIGVSYNADDEILLMVLESGVDYEKMDYFPGYKRVTLSDTIDIAKWGTIQFQEFALNTRLEKARFSQFTWIKFQFYNRSDHYIGFCERYCTYRGYDYCYSYGSINNIGSISLHYINSDNKYVYELYDWGRYPFDYDHYNIEPLEKKDLYADWNTNEGLRTSTDGTLAITFDFETGDKYVLMLRENGVKIGDWE